MRFSPRSGCMAVSTRAFIISLPEKHKVSRGSKDDCAASLGRIHAPRASAVGGCATSMRDASYSQPRILWLRSLTEDCYSLNRGAESARRASRAVPAVAHDSQWHSMAGCTPQCSSSRPIVQACGTRPSIATSYCHCRLRIVKSFPCA